MDGKEFFEKYKGDKEMCKHLQNFDVGTLKNWEAESVSQFSPGVITDDEIIYQQILDPTNLDDSKTSLKPMAFDTASSIGMSTNRLVGASMADIILRGHARAKSYNDAYPSAPQRSLWGFVPIPVSSVRKIVSDFSNDRGLFVYDTATQHDPSHADICQTIKEPRNFRSIRFTLYDLVKDTVVKLQDISTV